MNIQTICSFDLKILDIVARFPGSTHDSHIFNHSKIAQLFECGRFKDKILLGDGGYGLKEYLMTPLRNPMSDAEKLYNESQIRTRNTVERQYGVWKRRFPCLAVGMSLKPETVVTVITACAVLHNFCVGRNIHVPDDTNMLTLGWIAEAEHLMHQRDSQIGNQTRSLTRLAKIKQQQLINYFNFLYFT